MMIIQLEYVGEELHNNGHYRRWPNFAAHGPAHPGRRAIALHDGIDGQHHISHQLSAIHYWREIISKIFLDVHFISLHRRVH